jgi:hypothetical protein
MVQTYEKSSIGPVFALINVIAASEKKEQISAGQNGRR